MSEAFRPKPMGKRHSACQNHLGLAVADMSGLAVRVQNVSKVEPGSYTCSCGEKATWFFIELAEVIVS